MINKDTFLLTNAVFEKAELDMADFALQAFQRQIHERLTQLELINKQYRRLARENRTDSASKLKQMVHEGNQRWDNLQKRVAAILRRLKVTAGWPSQGWQEAPHTSLAATFWISCS